MIDPASTRYTQLSADRRLTALSEKVAGSRATSDMTAIATAAASIWSAENITGDPERLFPPPRVRMLPSAQPREPMNNTSTPISFTWPLPTIAPGPMRIPIPTSPRPRPKNTGVRGRTPRGRSQSMRTIQIGTVDTISATIPDGTDSSDHTTAMLPMPSMRTPVIAANRQSRADAGGAPLQRASAYKSVPATTNRDAPSMKGGIVSMAYLMKRYVDPHSTYTAA